MYMYNGKILPINAPFEINGTWYPDNWLQLTTAAEKEAVGIIQVADKPAPPYFDGQYYDDVDLPKPLDNVLEGEETIRRGLKPQWTEEFKKLTNLYLQPTDWVVLRKLERNIDIPEVIAAYRAAVLVEGNRIVDAIKAATTAEEVKAAINSQQWPVYN